MTLQPPPPPMPPGAPPPPGPAVMPVAVYDPIPGGLQGPRYAGFWIRFVAYIIDSIIADGVTFGLIFATKPVSCLTADGSTCLPGTTTVSPLLYLFLAIPLVYFVALWAIGGTVGQRVLGLRVVSATTGQDLGIGRALLRLLGYLVSSAVLDIGLIWAAFDSRKQGWHDKIAGSLVIHRR